VPLRESSQLETFLFCFLFVTAISRLTWSLLVHKHSAFYNIKIRFRVLFAYFWTPIRSTHTLFNGHTLENEGPKLLRGNIDWFLIDG
jgi:hypothetical protein